MRALTVPTPGPADVLTMAELADPEPGPGEISIDVELAGTGFVDTLFRSGAFELPTPFVPGIEVVGRVRASGPGVVGREPGMRVAALLNDFGRGQRAGGYAEIAVAAADMTAPVPDGADPAAVLATVVNGVTAWIALHDLARVRPDDRVVVLGATGGLGATTCRLAAVAPVASVIGVAGSAGRIERIPSECTAAVVAGELSDRIGELTPSGADVVIDPVGGALRAQAYELLAPFGRLLVLGNASGDDPAVTLDRAWHDSSQIIGLSLGGVAHLVPDRVGAALTAVIALVARGVLREPAPAIVPLEQAAEVHRALENRTAPAKTLLRIGG